MFTSGRVSLSQTALFLGLFMLVGLWTSPAKAAQLQLSVEVDANVITLADLFDDAGAAANVTVAKAPAPGTYAALSVSKIAHVARRNGLSWKNRSGVTRVTVTRTGIQVPEFTVQTALADALTEQMTSMPANSILQVELAARSPQLYVASDAEPTVKVERLSVDRRTGKFQALLRAPAESNSRLRKVAGHAYPVTEVPVPIRQVVAGDVITERDFEWVKLPTNRISRNLITDARGLVGMSPRRSLRIGQPVRLSDVEAPVIIAKGALVQVTYVNARMTLTTKGRALRDAALGEVVDILNLSSHQTIQGIASAPNQVRVNPFTPPTSS